MPQRVVTAPTIQGPLNVVSVITPLFRNDAPQVVQEVSLIAQYNQYMGFNTTIVYDRGTYMKALLTGKPTSRLLRHGKLKVWLAWASPSKLSLANTEH